MSCSLFFMMYLLRKNDVIRYAHNDVASAACGFGRNEAMFAIMCRKAHIISAASSLAKPRSFARARGSPK